MASARSIELIDRWFALAKESWRGVASGELTAAARDRLMAGVRAAFRAAADRSPIDPATTLGRLRGDPFALLRALDELEQAFYLTAEDLVARRPSMTPAALLDHLARARDAFAAVRQALTTRLSRRVADSADRVAAMRTGLDHADRLASVGTMAAGLAHELNNMLGGVQAYAELALGRDDRRTMRRALHQIVKVGARTIDLTRSLLSAAHKQEPHFASHDLGSIVRDAVELIAPRLAKDDVVLEVDVSGAPQVVVDRGQVQQVLFNLILNARDAVVAHRAADAKSPRTVTVSCGRRGRFGTVRVRDNGPGIPPEHVERIFEPFFTTKGREGGGTGLGLSVSLGIIDSHGGRVEVRSREGRGATFSVLLPVERRTGAVAPAPKRRKSDAPRSAESARRRAVRKAAEGAPARATILVIEDEAVVRNLLRDLLGSLGHTVLVARTVKEARRRSVGKRLDVVIADYVVPGMSGIEVFDRLRAEHPDVAIVLTTGRVPHGDAHLKSLIDAADAFLEKPFSLPAARETILGLLPPAERAPARRTNRVEQSEAV